MTLNAGEHPPTTENILLDGGVSARVVYSEEDLPALMSGGRHVFLMLSDQIGSNTFIIDQLPPRALGQLPGGVQVHRQGRGRRGRAAYFGARYLSLGLGRWMSADPATVHELRGDANPYAYVSGRTLIWTDPDGRLVPILAAVVIGAAIGGAISGGMYAATAGSSFSMLGLGAAVGWEP